MSTGGGGSPEVVGKDAKALLEERTVQAKTGLAAVKAAAVKDMFSEEDVIVEKTWQVIGQF